MSSKNNLKMVGESLPGKWWGSLDFGSQAVATLTTALFSSQEHRTMGMISK